MPKQPTASSPSLDSDISSKEDLLVDGAMDVPAASQFSGWGRTTLYKMMTAGRLPYLLGPGRMRRIPKRALLRLMAAQMVGGTAI